VAVAVVPYKGDAKNRRFLAAFLGTFAAEGKSASLPGERNTPDKGKLQEGGRSPSLVSVQGERVFRGRGKSKSLS
jgi:hypothetical protein